MTWGAPHWLLVLALALLATAIAARARRRRRASLRRFVAPAALQRARPPLEAAAAWLALAGCAVLSVALAQPQLRAGDETRREPPPCIFVLDVSRSMLAEDVAPNRFTAASARLLARARAEPGRRFGLVAFAGEAREVAPPTSDHDALAALLAELDPRRSADPGSAVGRGIAKALARLEQIEPGGRGEIVVLSDGEWDDAAAAGDDPATLVTRARAMGVAIGGECFGLPAPSAIVVRDDHGVVIESAPRELTTASPTRLAELVERAGSRDNDGAGNATEGGAEDVARRSRAWALLGLALLAAAHWFAGRDE